MKNAILAFLVLAPALAFADVKSDIAQVEQATQKCLDNPENYSTAGMNGCLNEGYEAADKILNSYYRQLTSDLKRKSGDKETDAYNAEILNRLIKSERAWIAFRDAQSSYEGTTMLGGSGETTTVLNSLYDMTKARVLQLELTQNGGEGC